MFQYVSVSSASGDDLLLCKGLRSASALGCLGFDAVQQPIDLQVGKLTCEALAKSHKDFSIKRNRRLAETRRDPKQISNKCLARNEGRQSAET